MPTIFVLALLAVSQAPGEDLGDLSPSDAADATTAADSAAADGSAADSADADADAAAADQPEADDADAAADDTAAIDDAAEDSAEDEGADEPARDSSLSQFWQKVDEITGSGAIGLVREGGFFMWPILLMAVIALGVMIERYRSLRLLATDSDKVRGEVGRLLNDDQAEAALELCEREQGPVPAILSAGLRKYVVLRRLDYDRAKIEEQVVKGMDDYSVHVVAALERHLPILATISSVAPMLGFLGTVQGMIVAFNEIKETMGEQNIVEAAAAGIGVSLLTTCFGLIVGIPAYIAFNYFTSVINRFVLEVEESATELIESVSLQQALSEKQAT